MSFYRLLRFTAILAMLKRYRQRLSRLAAATALALVTSWLYPDIAVYIAAHKAHWAGIALALKTGLIYLLLFYGMWQVKQILSDDQPPARPQSEIERQPTARPSPLDELVDKPKLQSRHDAILNESKRGG